MAEREEFHVRAESASHAMKVVLHDQHRLHLFCQREVPRRHACFWSMLHVARNNDL